MHRNPRSTTPCRPPPARAGGGEPSSGLAQVQCPRRGPPKRSQVQSTIPKRGPPPAPPKKLDYKKPAMTKAMAQRLKHTQKLQEELARKEAEKTRKIRRTAAPIGGDARMGRERRPGDRCRQTKEARCLASSTHRETPAPEKPCPRERSQPAARERSAGPSGSGAVPARTKNLAESMNADIVHAEPLRPGLVDNLIIPPGAIDSEKTTIVSIPQPEASQLNNSTIAASSSHPTNKSAQLIAETLDEQDAAEAAVVNSKLQDMQQARRDFVMAVANVGGNAVNLQEDEDDCPGIDFPNFSQNVTPIANITSPRLTTPPPPSPPTPKLYRCPSLEDPELQIRYHRNHPVVEAARDYLRRAACLNQPENEPEPEYLEECPVIGAENNDEVCPAPTYTAIPRRQQPYYYLPMDVDRLERFFDLENYPPPSPCTPPPPPPPGTVPPTGRECLPEDLWELEDPWYREPVYPDLIEWSCEE